MGCIMRFNQCKNHIKPSITHWTFNTVTCSGTWGPCFSLFSDARLWPEVHPRGPLSCRHHGSDPPAGTSLHGDSRTLKVFNPPCLRVQPQRHLSVRPAFIGVRLADALGSLEGVEGVGEVDVRVRLVHQLVQRHDGLHHPHLGVRAACPFCMLQQSKNWFTWCPPSRLEVHATGSPCVRPRSSLHLQYLLICNK